MPQTIRWICKECKKPFEDWDILDKRTDIWFVELECKECERKISLIINVKDEFI